MGVRWQSIARSGALLAAGIALIGAVRGRLFETHGRVKETHDVYLLPPPSQVKTLALGYDAAVADVLWAHTLVAQGLHLTERRRYDNVLRLYDAINELDPSWRTPYLLADALITLQSAAIGHAEVVATRRILERGVQQRPLDAELWLNLGQFVAFIAPSSYLDDRPDLVAGWREDGLRYLERAAELGAESRLGWQALGGAARLVREGKREAAIRYYERQYAVTEDPELRATIERHLAKLLGEQHRTRVVARRHAFDALREAEFPWLRNEDGTVLLLGPRPAPKCAGHGGKEEPECATTWREWSRRFDASR